MKLGFYKKAKSILMAYTQVNRDPSAIGLIAIINIFLSDTAASETYAVRALSMDRNCSEALFAKAYINLVRGNSEEALRIYFAILAAEPNNKLAKANIESIKKMKGYVKKYSPRKYLLTNSASKAKNPLMFLLYIALCSFFIYFSVNVFYPFARIRFLDKEQRELREKLKSVYLFEGLSNGQMPEDAVASETYTPKQITDMFDYAKKKIGTSDVNAAMETINKVLISDVNDYLKERFKRLSLFITPPDYAIFKNTVYYSQAVSNIPLYIGSFVKWNAEVESVEIIKDENAKDVKVSRLLVYGNDKKIDGVAELVSRDSVNISAKTKIEVYAKIKAFDNSKKILILDSIVIKHLPN